MLRKIQGGVPENGQKLIDDWLEKDVGLTPNQIDFVKRLVR